MTTNRENEYIQTHKVIQLNYDKSKSPKEVTKTLEEALKFARKYKTDSVFICFGYKKRQISKRNSHIAVRQTDEDLIGLTKQIENGYELIQQMWDRLEAK